TANHFVVTGIAVAISSVEVIDKFIHQVTRERKYVVISSISIPTPYDFSAVGSSRIDTDPFAQNDDRAATHRGVSGCGGALRSPQARSDGAAGIRKETPDRAQYDLYSERCRFRIRVK